MGAHLTRQLLDERWQRLRVLLAAVIDRLPADGDATGATSPSSGPLRGTRAEAQEFLAHDEYGLAWEALAAVAERAGADARTWGLLDEAADLMEIRRAQHA